MPKHTCKPVANLSVAPPRRMWLGEIITISGDVSPTETHCLHISQDGVREAVLFLDAGDAINLRVVSDTMFLRSHPDNDWYQGYLVFCQSPEKLNEVLGDEQWTDRPLNELIL